MARSGQGSNSGRSGLQNFALFSSVVGGGVVGLDYARWLDIDPLVGSVIGAIASLALTSFLIKIKNDADGSISRFCTSLGAFAGAWFGIMTGVADPGGAEGLFLGLIIGAIGGAVVGQLIAALVSLLALVFLLISRGPIGLYLRNVVLKPDESEVSPLISESPQLDFENLLVYLHWNWPV